MALPVKPEASSVKSPVPAARIACWNPLIVETEADSTARSGEGRVRQRHVRRAVEHQPRVEPAADQDVVATAAGDRGVAGPARDGAGAGAAVDDVVTRAADDRVVARAGRDGGVARAADDDVVAVAAQNQIIATAAGDRARQVAGDQDVVTRSPHDRLRAVAAFNRIVAGAAVR